jgi:hypothetical protein
MYAYLLTLIKLTSAKGAYIVVEIINRDRWMTSRKMSLRPPLLDTISYAKSCHITQCKRLSRCISVLCMNDAWLVLISQYWVIGLFRKNGATESVQIYYKK